MAINIRLHELKLRETINSHQWKLVNSEIRHWLLSTCFFAFSLTSIWSFYLKELAFIGWPFQDVETNVVSLPGHYLYFLECNSTWISCFIYSFIYLSVDSRLIYYIFYRYIDSLNGVGAYFRPLYCKNNSFSQRQFYKFNNFIFIWSVSLNSKRTSIVI